MNYNSQRNTAAWRETNRQLLDAIKEYGIMLREVPEGSIDDVDVNASPLTWLDT